MVLKVTTGWDRSCWRAEGVGCIALDLLLPLFFVVRLEYFYLHLGKIFVQHAIVRRLLGTSSVLGWGCKGRERET